MFVLINSVGTLYKVCLLIYTAAIIYNNCLHTTPVSSKCFVNIMSSL